VIDAMLQLQPVESAPVVIRGAEQGISQLATTYQMTDKTTTGVRKS
jgi:hypothetical protein